MIGALQLECPFPDGFFNGQGSEGNNSHLAGEHDSMEDNPLLSVENVPMWRYAGDREACQTKD